MNHIYRTIWNEVTQTFVAASERVSAKGQRSGSCRTASAETSGDLEAQGHCADSAGPVSAFGKALVAPGASPMLLEQRFVFDGAGAVEAVDDVDVAPAYDKPEQESASQAEGFDFGSLAGWLAGRR